MTSTTPPVTDGELSKLKGYHAGWVWAGLGLFIGALFLKRYASGDIWFLLLTGRYVLETGTVPQHEFFTYIAAGKPEIFGGWGFGTIFELIKRGLGTAAIYYAYAALWAATFLVGIATWRAGDGKNWRTPFTVAELSAIAAACFVTYYVAVTRSWLRPEVTMYLLLSIGFLLFETDRRMGRQTRSQIVYPLLVWLEAWLHTAGIIMLLLPVAYAVEAMTGHLASQRRINGATWLLAGRWTACLGACIILPVFNPNGAAQVYLHVLIALQKIEFLRVLPLLTLSGLDKLPLEHLVPTHNLLEYWPAWHIPELMQRFGLLAFASTLILAFSKRRLFHACLIMPLGLLALLHNRGLGPWAMVMLPWLCALLSNAGQSLLTILPAPDARRLLQAITLCATGGTIAIAVTFAEIGMPQNSLPIPNGTPAIHTAYPQGGNVFASYLLAAPTAYALGNRFRVPIGAHIMFYFPEMRQHFVKTASAGADYESELLRHNVVAVVHEAADGTTGEIALLPARLILSKHWRLAAADEEGVILIRLRDDDKSLTDSAKLEDIKQFWQAVQRQAATAMIRPSENTRRSIAFAAEQIRLSDLYAQAPQQALAFMARNLESYIAKYGNAPKL